MSRGVLTHLLVVIYFCAACSSAGSEAERLRVQNAVSTELFGVDYGHMLPLAENGDAEAQFLISFGINPEWRKLPRDEACKRVFVDSLYWLRRSALSGHPRALNLLGDYISIGTEGYPKDEVLGGCFKRASSDLSLLPKCAAIEEHVVYPGFGMTRDKHGRLSCRAKK
jgi:TPR repeat protein